MSTPSGKKTKTVTKTTPNGSVRVTRVEEKRELHSLNDRLESYVLHNKAIELENEALKEELARLRKQMADQVTNVSRDYKNEIKKMKKTLTSVTNKHTDTDLENARLRAEIKSLKDALAEVPELRNERRRLEEQVRTVVEELSTEKTRRQHGENELKEYKDMMAKQEEVVTRHEEELSQAQQNVEELKMTVAKANDDKQRDYNREIEQRLQEAQKEWQIDTDNQLKDLENKLRQHFEQSTVELRERTEEVLTQVDRLQRTLSQSSDKEREYKRQIADLQREIMRLEQQLTEAARARMAKEKEFNDLMDVKITLDAEIDKYRQILDVEEKRSGYTPKKRPRESAVVPAEPDTKTDDEDTVTVTTKRSTTKRQRRKSLKKKKRRSTDAVQMEGTPSQRRSLKNKRSGTVKINDVDLVGDCVSVVNDKDEPVSMAGWKLLSKTGSQSFKYPDDLVLAPGARVTVWSGSHAKEHHNPPTDLFWTRRFIWNNNGDTAVLVNADGDEVSEVTGVPQADLPTSGDDTDDEVMGDPIAAGAGAGSNFSAAAEAAGKDGEGCSIM